MNGYFSHLYVDFENPNSLPFSCAIIYQFVCVYSSTQNFFISSSSSHSTFIILKKRNCVATYTIIWLLLISWVLFGAWIYINKFHSMLGRKSYPLVQKKKIKSDLIFSPMAFILGGQNSINIIMLQPHYLPTRGELKRHLLIMCNKPTMPMRAKAWL